MPNGLIRQGTLRRLRRRFGPKAIEGVCYIIREQEPIEEGAGYIDNNMRIGPEPVRVSFTSYYRSREELTAGRPGGEHRYLFELPAGFDIYPTDVIEYTGDEWAPELSVTEGLVYHPLVEDGHFYRAQAGGITGSTPPDWTAQRGLSLEDGDVVWYDMGPYNLFQVIEIGQVDSYEIVRDVYCDLRQ